MLQSEDYILLGHTEKHSAFTHSDYDYSTLSFTWLRGVDAGDFAGDHFPEGELWQPLLLSGFLQVNWQAIAAQTGKILTIPLITVLAMLLMSLC